VLSSCKQSQDNSGEAIAVIVAYLADLQERGVLPDDKIQFNKVEPTPIPERIK